MDGHLMIITVIIGRLHAPKFTDCYCSKQPPFATQLFSQKLGADSMAIRAVPDFRLGPKTTTVSILRGQVHESPAQI
jgi:hypothetical protein